MIIQDTTQKIVIYFINFLFFTILLNFSEYKAVLIAFSNPFGSAISLFTTF